MRIRLILALAALAMVACGRGNANKAAVLQGVMDHLAAQKDLMMSSMDVEISSVAFNGNHADATVTFTAKGVAAGQGSMSMRYQLEDQGGKWVVVNRSDSGGAPHGGAVSMPAGGVNPHGAMQPGAMQPGANPHGAGAAMPSPQDLPPIGKKP